MFAAAVCWDKMVQTMDDKWINVWNNAKANFYLENKDKNRELWDVCEVCWIATTPTRAELQAMRAADPPHGQGQESLAQA